MLIRLPLFDSYNTREYSTSKDVRFKNVLLEKVTRAGLGANETGEAGGFYLVKRPGVSTSTINTNDAREGRSIIAWNGSIYTVIGDRLYENDTEITALGNRFSSITGPIYWSLLQNNSNLIIQEGSNLWVILPNEPSARAGIAIAGYAIAGKDTAAQGGRPTQVTDADFPAPLAAGVVYLDQYTFVGDPTGYIYNSELADASSWVSGERLLSSIEPDQLVRLVKHKNYLVALCEWTTEFFYDAANPQGSPLLPLPGSVFKLGCYAPDSIYEDEDIIIWVSRSKVGGPQVVALNGMSPVPLSTPAIERLIEQEAPNVADVWAYGFRLGGHLLYILNLPSQSITLVYNTSTKTWTEFSSVDTLAGEILFNYRGAASLNGQVYLLHRTDGNVYILDVDNYQDNGNNINVEVVTSKLDLGQTYTKICRRLGIIADQATSTSTVTIDWTDDDYQNWSTARTVDLSKQNPTLYALGRFVRRAFRLKHTSNTPLRIEALEFNLTGNKYEGGNLT